MTRTLPRGFVALALTLVVGAGAAAEWEYSLGVHDMAVRDVDSHTYGIGGRAEVDTVTSAGRHMFGSVDLFVDHDKDDLDPDHIPMWWQTEFGIDGEFWHGSRKMFTGWTVKENTRMNTVSSIERQIHILPALVGGFDGDSFQASLQGGVGYLFLEIDDDAPRLRGYDRTNLRHTTSAGSLAADTTIRIGESWEVFGHAEEWWDGDDWVQNQFIAGFRFATERWASVSEVTFSAEVNKYNLDIFSTPGAPAILAWDDDLMIRLDFRYVRQRSRARK